MATAPWYERLEVYGPFHRLENERTQTAASMGEILRGGELWGNPPRWSAGISPRVQAYTGPLNPTDNGFEFYTKVEPDFPYGPRMSWSKRPGGAVRIEDGKAKVNVLVTRVTQDIE